MEQLAMNFPEWTRVAEVELVYKTTIKLLNGQRLTTLKIAIKLLKELWNENTFEMQEEFKVLLLNRANKVIGVYEASAGGLTGTVADPRLILAAAIKSLAVSIVLSHNHPSGNLKPSRADEELTQKIKAAAAYHDIKVIDHIIITSEGYYSFANEGVL
ncbi:MAG: JAB domain-containing protein [Chitinophagaceae bacterium]